MPLRYRKTCLNAYLRRRERSQNFDNNNAHPNIWFPTGAPILWQEVWTEYAAGQFSVTGVAGWSPQNYLFAGQSAYQTGIPANNLTVSGSSNTILTTAASGFPSINTTKNYSIIVNIDTLTPGSQTDGANQLQVAVGSNTGALTGFIVTNDTVAGLVFSYIYFNGVGQSQVNFSQGIVGIYSGKLTVSVTPTLLTLKNGTTTIGTQVLGTPGALTNALQMQIVAHNTPAVGTAMNINKIVIQNGP